jgi:catechol 2,3-dioxygenase
MPILQNHKKQMPNLLSPATRIGYVHYTVADLEKQIDFYTNLLGLQLHWKQNNSAGLGAGGADLVQFTEDKTAKRYKQATGLYHQALLLPNRKELARAIARLIAYKYPNSPTDHTISQTTYLEDPEGNTIELLADTPDEGTWEVTEDLLVVRDKQGRERHMSISLDLNILFEHLTHSDDIYQPMPKNTITGHIHLYVNNLLAAMHFYSDIIGFQRQNMMDTFKMADTTLPGFNVHIIAFNTWKGEHARPAPPPALGMRAYTINLTSAGEMKNVLHRINQAGLPIQESPEGTLVQDPVGNVVLLTQS